jgi:hypothetical protein
VCRPLTTYPLSPQAQHTRTCSRPFQADTAGGVLGSRPWVGIGMYEDALVLLWVRLLQLCTQARDVRFGVGKRNANPTFSSSHAVLEVVVSAEGPADLCEGPADLLAVQTR